MSEKKKQDPYLEREQTRYQNPIPSREFILEHLNTRQAPANFRQLAQELELEEHEKEPLKRRLKAMVRDEQLELLRKRRYWPAGQRVLIEGAVLVEKTKLWVVPNDGTSRILVVQAGMLPVFNGDKVIVSVLEVPQEIYREGRIVELIDKRVVQVVGRFVEDTGFNYVIPHGKEIVQDILVPEGHEQQAQDGQIVVIELLTKRSKWSEPIGKVIEILGDENKKNIEVEAAVRAFELPFKWSKEIKTQIAGLSETVTAQAKKNREDLRSLPFVTIDGEDAKDFDDAVFCEPRTGGGWRLYVAIADVSYYVKEKSPLDKEAKERGNSVYFPSTVIPMLPEVLSNGLCSLRPGVDRLAMVCEMLVSDTGKITRYKFYEAVIQSHARLTYTKVAKILTQESDKLSKQYHELLPHLGALHDLYHVLVQERFKRGAIEFDTVETRIIFGTAGKIKKIEPIQRNVAHKIIEECMLCANVSTAKFLIKNKIPGLYRIHETPPSDKVEDLRTFLSELGISLGIGQKEITPSDYGDILRKIKDRPDAQMIQTVLLRSLSQAVYSPDNIGHFGLAYHAYTHFTSPIRRYPDLVVHRQLKKIIHGKWAEQYKKMKEKKEKLATLKKDFQSLANHCSTTERRADDATRDVVRWLKCQYIADKVGEIFSGIVSGVTRFGFFVELEDIYIDGLVHVNSLREDFYIFDQVHHRLVGERTKNEYSLGQRVTVIVARVDVDERKIDFDLVKGTQEFRQEKKQIKVKKLTKETHGSPTVQRKEKTEKQKIKKDKKKKKIANKKRAKKRKSQKANKNDLL